MEVPHASADRLLLQEFRVLLRQQQFKSLPRGGDFGVNERQPIKYEVAFGASSDSLPVRIGVDSDQEIHQKQERVHFMHRHWKCLIWPYFNAMDLRPDGSQRGASQTFNR